MKPSVWPGRVADGMPGRGRRLMPASAVAFAVVFVVAGCGGSDDPTGSPSASTTPSSLAPTSTSASSGHWTDASTVSPPVDSPSVDPSVASTVDRTGEPAGEVVQLTGITATTVGSGEQVIIAATGALSGWTLRYVDAVLIDGEPYLVDGAAALELVLRAADPTGDEGFVDAVAEPIYPGAPIIQEVALVDFLGEEVTFAIGVAGVVPFSVSVSDTGLTITFQG